LEVAETHYRRVLEEANNLELKAPIAGYVLTPDVHQLTGKYIVPRQAIMRVGRRDSLRLILPLTETEVQLIELGSEVKGRWKSNAQKFETVIDVFPSQKASNTDYLDAMFTEFGGPAPREKMEQQNQFPNEPQFSLFLAEAPLTNQVMNHQVFEGMRVQATILGKKTTVGKKIWRNVVSFWDNNMRSLR